MAVSVIWNQGAEFLMSFEKKLDLFFFPVLI